MGIDIEGEALRLLERNGFDPAAPPTPEYLAMCEIGAARIVTRSNMFVPARYVPALDVIEVRAGLSNYRRQWNIGHELAERTLFRLGCMAPEVEQLADTFAGALAVPGPALRAALRRYGRSLPDLSAMLGVSQSVAALRLAESTGNPLVLVTRTKIMVRGDDFGWPSEREIRRVAVAEPLPEGLERRAITDARARVALLAA